MENRPIPKEFWISMAGAFAVFITVYLLVSGTRPADDLSQFRQVLESATEGMTPFRQIMTGNITFHNSLAKLALFPVGIFVLIGMGYAWKDIRSEPKTKNERRRRDVFGLFFIYVAIHIAALFFLWSFKLRYFAPLYPIMAIFGAYGLFRLYEKFKREDMRG